MAFLELGITYESANFISITKISGSKKAATAKSKPHGHPMYVLVGVSM
jgi:hypothetical protein